MYNHFAAKTTLLTCLLCCLLLPASAITLSSADITTLYNANFNAAAYKYVSVHDPSVVVGYKSGSIVTGENVAGSTPVYYIFGSHMAWAYSSDLKNWTSFTNNINSSYATLFATPAIWSAKGGTSYNVNGNMWAPDVVWNKKLQKWCMYMSINGDNWYSSIVLLTATTLNGSWTYVGPVVYSGFTSQSEAAETDFYRVVNSSEGFPARYVLNRNGNHTYGVNAIDPCTFYDENGNLWMSYGSWFGGIYLLRLDAETGLRDYTFTYPTNDGTAANATTDVYQGTKIAGGNQVSGEASYIQFIDGTYYLFITNGGLSAAGGYNMRVYSSKAVTGPYVDMTGQDARYSSSNTGVGSINGQVGLRLMSYYRWNWMSKGHTAQGHNSAMVDSDGKSFLVYHTRFNDGTEGHQVRVHQLFRAKNGFMTAAPFQYHGETLGTVSYPTEEVAGYYGILYHGTGTNYASLECVEEKEILLKADGTVSGAYAGTWSQAADGPYLTLTLNNVAFQGVLVKQKLEGLDYTSLCFTAAGSDMSVWGYRKAGQGRPFPENATVAFNVRNLNGSVPTKAYSGVQLSLPVQGHYGASYAWSWDTTLISKEGIVKSLASNVTTNLTLTVTCGDYNYTSSSSIQLLSKSIADLLPIAQEATMKSFGNTAEFNAGTPSSDINLKTGLSLSFYIEKITSDWDKIAHSSDNLYQLFLSVLRYNSADFYEAKASLSAAAVAAGYTSSNAWSIFLNTSCFVTVSYNTNGSISYYKDGVLMLTFAGALTPSYGSGTTPAAIVPAVINNYRSGKLIFDADVKNIVVGYATDLDVSTYKPLDVSAYAYYEDYDFIGMSTSWTTVSGSVTNLYDASLKSSYIQVGTNGSTGNRSATTLFSNVGTLKNYTFAFDACLTTGNVTDRSVNEVSLISTDNTNATNGTTSYGYLFRLVTPTYNGSNGGIWYVNGNSSLSLTFTSGTWVTIRGTVDVAAKSANVVVTNRSTGAVLYNGTNTVSGNGLLKGIWALAGRGTGTLGFDNIWVKDATDTGLTNTGTSIDPNVESEVYNLSGIRVATGRVSELSLAPGLYLVRQGKQVNKLMVPSN